MYRVISKVLSSPSDMQILFGSGKTVTFVNPYNYLNKKSIDILSQFDYLYVDGFLLANFIKLFYLKDIARKSFDMTSMAAEFFSYAENNQKTISLIGAEKDQIKDAVEVIKKHYPNIKIISYRDGYLGNEEKTVINELIISNPDYVIVGMGFIRQEEFVICLKNEGYKGGCFTCGGFFHQTTQKINYYPYWIDRFNLRWVYRLYKEPNVRSRIFPIIFKFPVVFIWDYFKYKFK